MFARVIRRSGVSHVFPTERGDSPPWVSHTDPKLLHWMGKRGYSTIEELPVLRDERPATTCERCGARGVETHHWAPKEWFGPEEAERWPTAELCRTCHQVWHWAAERAAAKLTVRILRGKGLHRTADRIEEALKDENPEGVS